MIFIDLIKKYNKELHPEFEKIFELGLKNQYYHTDLLLWKINGSFQENLVEAKPSKEKKWNTHVIGPGIEGFSDQTHYDFINQYRQSNVSKYSYDEYLKKVTYDPENIEEIDKLIHFESTSIQIEMLIYLKIWEADLMIKKMYELTRILNGESYNWYFKVAESSRDKNSNGTRQDIIRKLVRDKLSDSSPFLQEWISNIYKTQIRNSIAHSNYAIIGRNINLNNFIKDDPASQLHSLQFDEWHDIFHKLIVLHNQYIWLANTVNEYYASKVLSGEVIDILISERDGNQYSYELEYRAEYKDWSYKQT